MRCSREESLVCMSGRELGRRLPNALLVSRLRLARRPRRNQSVPSSGHAEWTSSSLFRSVPAWRGRLMRYACRSWFPWLLMCSPPGSPERMRSRQWRRPWVSCDFERPADRGSRRRFAAASDGSKCDLQARHSPHRLPAARVGLNTIPVKSLPALSRRRRPARHPCSH